MLRVSYADLEQALTSTLIPLGFTPARAGLCARLFTETTCDGVYTHGLNRFPRFLATIRNGVVNPTAEPTLTSAFGAIERWHGNRGAGNLNAHASMARAIALARTHGIGCVALAQTNHWMRGGTYGWQAADQGLFAISFTNTLPNLPVWGSSAPTLGNNPLVLAIPRPEGRNIVLDMAMSQYSYGTLTAYAKRGAQLPYPGGFDAQGNMTTDPAAIEQTARALPIGLWKGSGLSLTLDLIAAMLSGGLATHQIETDSLKETGLSQLFLAIDPTHITDPEALAQTATQAIADLQSATPIDPSRPPRYPGEETLRLREENLRLGIPVEEEIWNSLAKS
ncbi:3-dehydro-L-gulonate 2-dehydrogenase [Granulicella tundricola]|uniref:Malate/L-lactate dehydrogenase n=1 Tax=Granulicella tundricola (strain ATCC BAA-1859 / DSM 23138 / MP5ACTX9) TaxID=1198114 RepID=E8WYW4_GRATM|nr:3-dehydro-L-gulonate 2-dehydrogenase [Granulicella tundricola]ADW68800.1 Malate/L-lactate dehydrogenase [Granulicella tundricola MP5ACTX9]